MEGEVFESFGVGIATMKELTANIRELRNLLDKVEKALENPGEAWMVRAMNASELIKEAKKRPARRHKQ